MPSGPKIAKDPKPLYAKLPISLHVALWELADRRLRKSGVEVDQKELLEEAIRKLIEAEGIDLSQIEADVSKWSAQQKKPSRVHTFPRKRGPKTS
jgi:hypothetical protein